MPRPDPHEDVFHTLHMHAHTHRRAAHTAGAIFAICCDPETSTVYTGGQDCPLAMWSTNGHVQQA